MSVVFLRHVDLNDVCNSNTVADLQVLTTVSVLASFVFFCSLMYPICVTFLILVLQYSHVFVSNFMAKLASYSSRFFVICTLLCIMQIK